MTFGTLHQAWAAALWARTARSKFTGLFGSNSHKPLPKFISWLGSELGHGGTRSLQLFLAR